MIAISCVELANLELNFAFESASLRSKNFAYDLADVTSIQVAIQLVKNTLQIASKIGRGVVSIFAIGCERARDDFVYHFGKATLCSAITSASAIVRALIADLRRGSRRHLHHFDRHLRRRRSRRRPPRSDRRSPRR